MEQLLNSEILRRLEDEEVLIYYDRPILFSCRYPGKKFQAGQLYMAVLIEDEEEFETFFYVAVSLCRYSRILSGDIDLYDTFKEVENGIVYRVRSFYNSNEPIITSLKCTEIEDKDLPERKVFLK